MEQLTRRVAHRVASLPPGLQDHIRRVRDIAVELAPHHGVDPARASRLYYPASLVLALLAQAAMLWKLPRAGRDRE